MPEPASEKTEDIKPHDANETYPQVWAVDLNNQSTLTGYGSQADTGLSDAATSYANQQALSTAASTACYTSSCGVDCMSGYSGVTNMNGQPGYLPTAKDCSGDDLEVRRHLSRNNKILHPYGSRTEEILTRYTADTLLRIRHQAGHMHLARLARRWPPVLWWLQFGGERRRAEHQQPLHPQWEDAGLHLQRRPAELLL